MRFFDHQASARSRSRRLVAAFILAVALTVVAMHGALSALWWLFSWLVHTPIAKPVYFMQVNVGLTLLMVLGGWWIETTNLAGGGVKLAERLGARAAWASQPDEKRLRNIVDEVCIAAHMPAPQVLVLPRALAINAFATGWQPADWAISVTQGALQWLTRDELQGLVAHECSHLAEGDTRLNMQLLGMVGGLEMVYNFGDSLRDPDNSLLAQPGHGLQQLNRFVGITPAMLIGWVVMGVGYIGWLAGRALQAAVAREREYLADARAVQWTRNRDGLGGVLRKALAQRNAAALYGPPRGSGAAALWQTSTHHLLLVSNLPRQPRPSAKPEPTHWLATHPPLTQRIKRLYGRQMPPLPLVALG